MSILIDESTKLIIQGITGREGSFHAEQMLSYGTKVVAGVTPGKGGQKVLGVPVFNTVREALYETGANCSISFVPALQTKSSLMEAISCKVPLVITIAEHVPVNDMIAIYHWSRYMGVRVVGPNSFGIISPGKSKAGFMAHNIFLEGNVGIISRSATNCYETVHMLTKKGIGQSTCVGIGGDMIPGSSFLDLLPLFEADQQTRVIVLIGEIGGDEEERAAKYIKSYVTKPTIAFVAGRSAPRGQNMGHAGAIVEKDGTGSAEHKERALAEAGVLIAENTEHIVDLVCRVVKGEGII